MLSPKRPYARAVCALTSLLLGGGACALLGSLPTTAHAANIGQLQHQISSGQSKISALSSQVNVASSHLSQLQSNISTLERQINRIQADLDAKRAELLKLRTQLNAARVRLAQLEAFEAHAQTVLSRQLVNS